MSKYITTWRCGLPETVCGRGSKLENTQLIRDYISEVVETYDIQSIADIGCGDQNWIKHVPLPDWVEYRGYDIEHTHERFDCVTDKLPKPFDLVLMIFVLNHLHSVEAGVVRALRNVIASGSKYLLATVWEAYPLPLLGKPLEEIHLKTRPNGHKINYALYDLRKEIPNE